jgi:hypothetical protein
LIISAEQENGVNVIRHYRVFDNGHSGEALPQADRMALDIVREAANQKRQASTRADGHEVRAGSGVVIVPQSQSFASHAECSTSARVAPTDLWAICR